MDAVFKSPHMDIRSLAITIQVYKAKCTKHGQPLQIIDTGETALDEQIFEEVLAGMRDHHTADKVCLLLPGLLPQLPQHLILVLVQYHILGNDTQHANARQQLAHDIHPG